MFRDLEIWLNHFEYHAEHPRCVPAGLSDVLKPEERRLIARSIAVFQLCEQPEGSALLRAAQRFAEKHKAAPITRITELFIREQQRHATLLAAFMEDHGIARKHTDRDGLRVLLLASAGRVRPASEHPGRRRAHRERLLPRARSRDRVPAAENTVSDPRRRRARAHRTGIAIVAGTAGAPTRAAASRDASVTPRIFRLRGRNRLRDTPGGTAGRRLRHRQFRAHVRDPVHVLYGAAL